MASNPNEPYKGPINQPCSACSAGDTAMEYHDHDYVRPENRRAASPLPAEPPPTELTLGEMLESASKEVATWEPWQRSLDPFGPATPSAAEPQKEE